MASETVNIKIECKTTGWYNVFKALVFLKQYGILSIIKNKEVFYTHLSNSDDRKRIVTVGDLMQQLKEKKLIYK